MKFNSRKLSIFFSVIFIITSFFACKASTDLHEHTYDTNWSSNETHHWHAATCEHENLTSDKAKHSWDSGSITTEPTCTENGKKTYTCKNCSYQKTESIPASGHAYSTDWSKDADSHWHAATCEHSDLTTTKTAHTFDSGTITKQPSCSETGVKTYTCTTCLYEKTEPINATGHTYSTEWSKDIFNHWHEATCEHSDLTTDKGQHTFDSFKISKAATCTQRGIKIYTCTVCLVNKEEYIPVTTEHTYSTDWSKDADSHWHVATCGHNDQKSATSSHTFDSGIITKQPTCSETGIKIYTCTVCLYEKTETIPVTNEHTYSTDWSKDIFNHWHEATCEHSDKTSGKAAHTFDSFKISKAATCTERGIKYYTCTVCSVNKEEYIPATGHTYNSGTVTTQPTTTSTGVKTYTCTVCSATKTETIPKIEVVAELTSVEFAKTLVIGWNLGNALDASACDDWAYSEGNNLEYSWLPHKVPASQNLIKAVKAAGFETIRIPISWHNHMNRYDTTNYTIDSSWMNRVKELVDWSLVENMKVIINIHHDNLTESQISNNPGFVLSTNSTYKTKSKNYISKVWTQIANTFKDYDNNLIFEVLNEPRCIETDWEWGFYSSETQAYAKTYCDIITEYEQSGLDAIRATGGNNATRYVMVPGYAASPFYLSYYTLPVDSASDKLLLSTHAYTPNDFALEGKITDYDSNKTYIESSINSLFSDLYRNYVSVGRGVVMGEASASDKNNTSSREKWATYYFTKAKAAGIPIVLWDNEQSVSDGATAGGENHGYFNRQTCAQYYPTIVQAMMNGNSSDVQMEDYGLMDGPLDLSASDWSINTTIPASRFSEASNTGTLVFTLEKATGYTDNSGYIKIQNEWSKNPILEQTDTVSLPGTYRFTPSTAQWNAIKSQGLIIYGYGPKVVYLKIE